MSPTTISLPPKTSCPAPFRQERARARKWPSWEIWSGRPSLPWPDPADVYRFFLNKGDTATLVANNLTAGQLQLQLENGSGQTLALGGSDANNVSQYIDGFVAPSSDYYYASVTGSSNVQYSLVVTRNAEFNLEPDDFFRPGQSLFGLQTLIGHLDANTNDYYYVPANVGDQLAFSTSTPTSGPPEIQNGFYPELLLYDPNGNLVAVASGNASDGRNSIIDFTVPSGDAGQWGIEVTASPIHPMLRWAIICSLSRAPHAVRVLSS